MLKKLLSAGKAQLWRGLSSLFALLLAIVIGTTAIMQENAGIINSFLGLQASSTSGEVTEENMYYKSEYTENGLLSEEGQKKLLAAEDAFCAREQEEGSVLVKNDGALPLAESERSVTLFGRAVADPVYRCNSGGPAIDQNRLVSLKGALESAGFSINQTLYDAYASSSVKRATSLSNESTIGEVDSSFYTKALQDSYANEYNDVAIVMFAREGGEGYDLERKDIDGVSALSLHKQEADLLKMIKSSGKFKKTVVLINSSFAMDLGWVEKEEYGVDACLWIGGPGLKGFTGVANILTGKANPSGRFVDTYAASQISSPAMQNFGDFTWTNVDEVNATCKTKYFDKYLVEAESIYVGYKYYESRYEDVVLGVGNANSAVGRTETMQEGGKTIDLYDPSVRGWDYAVEMAYPFGYGLSYTEFEETIVADSFGYDAEADEFTVQVEVTNTGDTAGKHSVLLYAQQPYTEYDRQNLVEKSSIQLVGFNKTQLLEPGASETLTISVDRYLLASYDYTAAKTYILEQGNYYFAIGDDVHDALNNILAKKAAEGDTAYGRVDTGKMTDANGAPASGDSAKAVLYALEEDDFETYSVTDTGKEVTNVYVGDDAVDINDFLPEGQKITYLTRGGGGNDWATSYPAPVSLAATDEMMRILDGGYTKPADVPSVDSFAAGKASGISFVEMKDVSFEDEERWNAFIDQLSHKELTEVLEDNTGSPAITSVAFPGTFNQDGPDGFKSNYKFGDKGPCTTYVNEVVAASTFSYEIFEQLGNFYAEDALYSGGSQAWCPGGNLHRTPFSGRNFEYYSEDSYLNYLYESVQCKAMQERGVLPAIKHFAANDQETNRLGVSTFMTEQRMRQECLRGFEGAFTKGGGLSTMSSYNRVGCVADCASYPTNTTVLREEWGFKGVVITDAAKDEEYMQTLPSLIAGSDMFCMNSNRAKVVLSAIKDGDGYILQCAREANKHFYYAYSRTNAVNGLEADTVVTASVYWWQVTLYAVIGVVGLAALLSLGACACSSLRGRGKKGEGDRK